MKPTMVLSTVPDGPVLSLRSCATQNDLVDGLEVVSTLGMLSGMTRDEKVRAMLPTLRVKEGLTIDVAKGNPGH